jgi:hypothetical protein
MYIHTLLRLRMRSFAGQGIEGKKEEKKREKKKIKKKGG